MYDYHFIIISSLFRFVWRHQKGNAAVLFELFDLIGHLRCNCERLFSICCNQSVSILFDTQTSFTAIPIYDEEHSVYHKSQFNFFFFRFSWNFIQFPPILREILYLAWCWLQPNTELESIGRLFYEVSL